MGRRCRPGPLPGESGTIIDVLKDCAFERTFRRREGGPFITVPALSYTSYQQVMPMFRSKKRDILAIERLENSMVELKTNVNELKAANKRLELEWTETYDKIRHQLSRMARRGDLAKETIAQEIEPANASDEPLMDPISQSIHARRNRSFIGRT